jgi:signal transduction histidine kinase
MLDNKDIALGIISAFILISIIVFFCIALVRLHFNKIKKYTAQLYRKDLDFQKTLNTTIMETQEQVLENISQDLHDDAGQQLTYINLQVENLKLDSPELKQLLQPLSESVNSLSESIRSISHSLNNQLVTQQDLLKAITAETERLNKNRGTIFSCHISGENIMAFDANEKIVIYRIFQEIINNVLKHAKAKKTTITIHTNPFEMTIADNGKGFEVGAVMAQTRSLGLKNLSGRATLIGYRIVIDSTPGKGTAVTLSKDKTA